MLLNLWSASGFCIHDSLIYFLVLMITWYGLMVMAFECPCFETH